MFDFITDERFRASLNSDYQEMVKALENGGWKSVHVLAGSIIEAVLVDYLLSIGYASKDPLKMDLVELVEVCKGQGVLSDEAVSMSTAVRGFRNLIHPGRIIRLEKKIDQRRADIAKALMELIVDEIETKRKDTLGYTAEQIVGKLQKDMTAVSILSHILRETREHERRRLLTKVLPEARAAWNGETDPIQLITVYDRCFRVAFALLSDDHKKEVAARFPKIIKEGDEIEVTEYGTTFFWANDLDYLNDADRSLVAAHLLSKLEGNAATAGFLERITGISQYLNDKEQFRFSRRLVRLLLSSNEVGVAAKELIQYEFHMSIEDDQAVFHAALQSLIKQYVHGDKKVPAVLITLRDEWEGLGIAHETPQS
jgi:hypothetical protein